MWARVQAPSTALELKLELKTELCRRFAAKTCDCKNLCPGAQRSVRDTADLILKVDKPVCFRCAYRELYIERICREMSSVELCDTALFIRTSTTLTHDLVVRRWT